jgi:hypothetical protein
METTMSRLSWLGAAAGAIVVGLMALSPSSSQAAPLSGAAPSVNAAIAQASDVQTVHWGRRYYRHYYWPRRSYGYYRPYRAYPYYYGYAPGYYYGWPRHRRWW